MLIKKALIPLLLVFIVVFLTYVIFLQRKQQRPVTVQNQDGDKNGESGQKMLKALEYTYDPCGPGVISTYIRADPYLRKYIRNKKVLYFHANGVTTDLSDRYEANSPLVEIRFKIRLLDGTIKPLYLDSIYLDCASGRGTSPGLYTRKGSCGLRLEIWQRPRPHTYDALLYDEKYSTRGTIHVSDKTPALSRTYIDKVEFRTPEQLRPGQIYTIELLLFDRIWQQKQLERKKAEAEKIKQLQEQEKITVVIREYPDEKFTGRLTGIYRVEGEKSEFNDYKSPGQMELKGPNKLGGELAVYVNELGQPARVWAYIQNLQGRNITLPDDAEQVFTEDDFVQVALSLTELKKKFNLAKWEAVVFYPSQESELFFFPAVLHEGSIQVTDYSNVPLEIAPGNYFIKACANDAEGRDIFIALASVEIDKTPGRTYTIKIPNGE